MANLIRLKQIESSSFLETAGAIGQDFSQSVNSIVSQSIETTFSASIVQIITNNVGAVLPEGVVSGSTQIVELGFTTTSSFHQYTSSLGDTFATDLEVYITASNIIDQGEF